MNAKVRYRYSGPVVMFDRLIAPKWEGETIASSEKEARSHLTYQFKTNHNLAATARVNLPGKLKALETVM